MDKDLDKVRWKYAKLKGLERHPRKAEIRRVKPSTLEELKEVVTDFCDSLDEEEVRRAVRDVRPRAELCLKMGGGHFESQLKKYKRGTLEE